MVKRCSWGECNSDTRYKDRLQGGVVFFPFPKPKYRLETCRRWIKACGRPHHQLNVDKVSGNYNLYVCSKHFHDGQPTEAFPDPIQATGSASMQTCTPKRLPPKPRYLSEPPKKKMRSLQKGLQQYPGV
ncbi:hypothetical protein ACF0H5_010271 [Mactra antiquata]